MNYVIRAVNSCGLCNIGVNFVDEGGLRVSVTPIFYLQV